MLICCDLCHPAAFDSLTISARTTTRQMRKLHIKTYDPGHAEQELRSTLLSWRDSRAKEIFPSQMFSDFGGPSMHGAAGFVAYWVLCLISVSAVYGCGAVLGHAFTRDQEE